MIYVEIFLDELKHPFLYSMDSLTDEDTEHFALCKMNDTLGPSSINTDPFLDDIRNGFVNDCLWAVVRLG